MLIALGALGIDLVVPKGRMNSPCIVEMVTFVLGVKIIIRRSSACACDFPSLLYPTLSSSCAVRDCLALSGTKWYLSVIILHYLVKNGICQ